MNFFRMTMYEYRWYRNRQSRSRLHRWLMAFEHLIQVLSNFFWVHPKFRKKLEYFWDHSRLKLVVQDNNWSPMLYIWTKLISKIKLFCRLLGKCWYFIFLVVVCVFSYDDVWFHKLPSINFTWWEHPIFQWLLLLYYWDNLMWHWWGHWHLCWLV